MKSIWMTAFLVVVFILIGIDSYGSYNSSIKYFVIDSRFVLIIFITANIILAFFNKYLIPQSILHINRFFFIGLSSLMFIFIFLNHYTYDAFVFEHFNIRVRNFTFLALLSGSIMYIKYSLKLNFRQKLVFLLPPLFLAILVFLHTLNRDLFRMLTREDGIFEWIQALFYLLSGLIFLSIARKLGMRKDLLKFILCLSLALSLIFVAIEEISWGQRVFGLEVPEWIAQNNIQKELNIHNNKSAEFFIPLLFMGIGLWGSLSSIVFSRLAPDILKRFRILVPLPIFSFYFFSVFMIYFLTSYVEVYYRLFTFERAIILRYQEVAELFLSTGFLLFALSSNRMK